VDHVPNRYKSVQSEKDAGTDSDLNARMKDMRHRSATTQSFRGRQSGFSLLELLIVVVVMIVVTVAALPNIANTLQIIRLRTSAQDVAGLLQRARIQAVKDNRFYSVLFTNGGQSACIDLNWNQQCDAGEPMVQLARNVTFVTDGSGAADAVIACGPVGYSTCPAGFTGLNYSPQAATVLPSYNARGLPCVGTPASPPPDWSANAQCWQFDHNIPPNYPPVGFLHELRYTGSNGNTYAAISITPSGLITVWLNSGTSWAQE
jgi:Tfp pilus assembly protein FimT